MNTHRDGKKEKEMGDCLVIFAYKTQIVFKTV